MMDVEPAGPNQRQKVGKKRWKLEILNKPCVHLLFFFFCSGMLISENVKSNLMHAAEATVKEH